MTSTTTSMTGTVSPRIRGRELDARKARIRGLYAELVREIRSLQADQLDHMLQAVRSLLEYPLIDPTTVTFVGPPGAGTATLAAISAALGRERDLPDDSRSEAAASRALAEETAAAVEAGPPQPALRAVLSEEAQAAADRALEAFIPPQTIADGVERILSASHEPLHVNALVEQLSQQFGMSTTGKNLRNTLDRWVNRKRRFRRVAPNTFARQLARAR